MDSEQSSPANDVSCCGYIQSELLLVEIVSFMYFAVLAPSTLMPSEELDPVEPLAWLGTILNTETLFFQLLFLSEVGAAGAQGHTFRKSLS